MMAIKWNNNVIIGGLLAVAMVVYFIYTLMPRKNSSVHLRRHFTWKTKEFVEVPPDLLDAAPSDVEITDRHLGYTFEGQDVSLFYLESRPQKERSIPVLLLHGAKFKSDNWKEHGTILMLAKMGYRVVALDLPGYGKSKALATNKPGDFLADFIKREQLDRPVIISPSMSGRYSLPYIMHNPQSCKDRIRGFIPIAPVGTENYKPPQYHRCDVPTMIIFGMKDKTLGLNSVGDLRNMADNEIFPVKSAGHAAYMEKPAEWHKLLYNFMLAVERNED